MLTHTPHVAAKREIVSTNFGHFSTISKNSWIAHLKKYLHQHSTAKRNVRLGCNLNGMTAILPLYAPPKSSLVRERRREWMDEDRESKAL